jgi:hypothetical protein
MSAMPLKSMIDPIICNRPFDRIDWPTGQIINLFAYLRVSLLTGTLLVRKIFELIISRKDRFAVAAKTN